MKSTDTNMRMREIDRAELHRKETGRDGPKGLQGPNRYVQDCIDELAAMNAADQAKVDARKKRAMDSGQSGDSQLNAILEKRIAERKRVMDSMR